MRKKKMRIPMGAAVAVLTLLIGALGVFAGWKYLAPENVANVLADAKLAKAFETEDAIVINETQEFGGYKITLLGIVSGKGLSEYTYWDDEGNIVDDMTYVVTAIENTDGTPRPDVRDENYGEDYFYVSPYIKGMSMRDYNVHTLGGGYSECVVEGVQYRILELENVEIFAKRGIYLGVSDGPFWNAEAYQMDAVTGEITRNEAYTRLNALFELPIPAFKGDETAVEAVVESMISRRTVSASEETEASEESEDTQSSVQTTAQAVETWTLEDFQTNAECVHEEELTPDEKGYIFYSYELESGGGSEATTLVEMLFEDMQPGFSKYMTVFNEDPTYVETFELLENGNVVLRVFEIQ